MITAQHKRFRPKLTKEEQAYEKQRREWAREDRAALKREKEAQRLLKANAKRELAILDYMLKTDMKYHHHGREDSMIQQIKEAINAIKTDPKNFKIYDPYVWNRLGEGNNYLPACHFGNLWSRSNDFDTIYEVPLDGSYRFYTYDSGQRGIGSFHYISCKKIEEVITVPKVNPGGFPPITC